MTEELPKCVPCVPLPGVVNDFQLSKRRKTEWTSLREESGKKWINLVALMELSELLVIVAMQFRKLSFFY